jgi:serine/threonine protein kinase
MSQSPNQPPPGANPPEPDRAEVIFSAALELPPGGRSAFVAKECGGDTGLRQQVESLLQAHDDAGGFLEGTAAPTPDKTVVVTLPVTEKAGDRIGRYKLLQQIGEGGCGVVYMAEQEEPVRRRVALKVIKLGMDTKSVNARFEAERQALALMDHPNIAKVLDAGATDNGRPFFVMELVRGIKITEYCDQNKLTTEDRLKLFVQVCHAIQHAHQKGIIHRDIKPSNILVTLHDGVPVPKVIDFGIAKATQGRLTDQTLFTAFEQFIGTPAYMSPEQAEMSGLDVDTRSDIYALGVLLYELLTGRTPFDAKELLASGLDQMRHTIREQEPQRPSTRLSTMLDADLTTTAKHRQTDVPKLLHVLQGDLDWIVMKTLEKDRTRRYETAIGLGVDIERYLNDEPVVARPPSSLYRFQKLARRNKTIFIAVGAVAIALIAGFGLSLYLFLNEAHLRARAERALVLEARLREAAELGKKFADVGLMMSRGRWDEADQLVNDLPLVPEGAAIYSVLAMIDARYGAWPKAVTNFVRLIRIRPNDPDNYHLLTPLLLQLDQADAYRQHCQRIIQQFGGTSDPVVAERMAKDCLLLPPAAKDLSAINRWVETAVAAGPQHPIWPWFEFVKGLSEYRQGNFAGAIEWEQKTLLNQKDVYRTAQAYMVMALAQHGLKQLDQARATLAQGLQYVESNLPKLDRKNGLDEMWNDWITAQVLVHEAKTLIDANPAGGAGAK